ncbi:hypothetical protein IJG78_03510 [Candidatus Saccharibacteria bacterium]|nr:hypothetical protein [Candidatus Saccharibacteria bacterium]
MELISILVIIVSVLTLFSGVTVFVGAEKSARFKALMFLITTFFAAIWSFAIIIFLTLPDDSQRAYNLLVSTIYFAPLLMMLAQVFYAGWEKKLYKVLGIIYMFGIVTFMVLFLIDSSTFYSGVSLSSGGNTVNIVNGFLYVYYFVLTILMIVTFVSSAFLVSKKATTKRLKTGNFYFAIGLLVTGIVAVLANLVLPIFGNYSLTYLGPLTLTIAIILHFYAILKYKIIVLSNTWLKLGSYVILMSMAAIAYMVVFSAVFSLLFKVKHLDTEVIVMNFIMIVIILMIFPVFNEISGFIRSLISTQQINMEYVIKKLNIMATQNVDFNDLAEFLADNMHFKYIGLIVGDKLYGSPKIDLDKEQLKEISMLEVNEHSIWQKIEGHSKTIFSEKEIVAVAELRNAKGRPFGQILVGKPFGKITFEKRDLTQIEMIINLVASIIDSEKRLKV